MKKMRIVSFVLMIALLGCVISNQRVLAAKKGTYQKSFNSGGFYRSVTIKKISSKKITFKMNYDSLRYMGVSTTITAKIKGNKVKFKFREAYALPKSAVGTGTMTLHNNYVILQTKIKNNCLSTDGKKVKLKRKG